MTYPSGAQALSADLVHDGRNDKAQSFNLTWSKGGKDFATKAQETFSTAGGTSSVHDRLNVVNSEALVNDLSVKVTLNWASSPTATKAEAVYMATQAPAEANDIADECGSIRPGRNADFVVLNHDLSLVETYLGGESVYVER